MYGEQCRSDRRRQTHVNLSLSDNRDLVLLVNFAAWCERDAKVCEHGALGRGDEIVCDKSDGLNLCLLRDVVANSERDGYDLGTGNQSKRISLGPNLYDKQQKDLIGGKRIQGVRWVRRLRVAILVGFLRVLDGGSSAGGDGGVVGGHSNEK